MHAAASLLLLLLLLVMLRRSFHEKRCRNIIKTDTKWCNFFNVPTAELLSVELFQQLQNNAIVDSRLRPGPVLPSGGSV